MFEVSLSDIYEPESEDLHGYYHESGDEERVLHVVEYFVHIRPICAVFDLVPDFHEDIDQENENVYNEENSEIVKEKGLHVLVLHILVHFLFHESFSVAARVVVGVVEHTS